MTQVNRFVGNPGSRIAVRDYGGHGLSVLLVHGLTHNVCVWDKVGPALAGRFRVAAFDLRGHGLTDASGDYSIEAQIGDIEAVRDALGMGRTLLVGHSLGAILSIAHACHHAADVPGVVNVDGSFADPTEFARELGIDRTAAQRAHDEWLETEWRFAGDATEVEGWIAEQRRGWDAWLHDLEVGQGMRNAREVIESFDDFAPILRRQLRETSPGTYERKPNLADWAGLSSQLLDPLWDGVSELYRRLETPILLVVARWSLDKDVSEEQMRALQGRILDRLQEGSERTRVEWVESSHNVPLVAPDVLSEMIGSFARGLDTPSPLAPS